MSWPLREGMFALLVYRREGHVEYGCRADLTRCQVYLLGSA